MDDTPTNDDTTSRSRCGAGFSRKARIGVAAAGLIGLGAALGGLATVSATAGAHMFRGHHGHSPDAITERALDKASWMLSRVDATPDQEARVQDIVTALVDEVMPLRDQHREHRRELVAELMREAPDPLRLESIRQEELQLADLASARMLDAVVQTAAVLTPEQRQELLERFTRRHRR